MKNFASLSLSLALLAATGFGISSCKEDEPPAKPKLSFAESEMTVAENAGTIEVEVVLDKPHSKDLTIEYELGGTASDQDVVGTANADYEVSGDHGVVVIEAGETTGVIELNVYSDAAFEPDETIEISFLDTNTDEIEVTADDDMVITITNDDAQLVATITTADMTVNESDGADGYINVTVQLDNAPTSDVTIEYTLEGSAIDSTFAFNFEPQPIPPAYYDYYINGASGELVIPAGSTSGNIEIQLFSDFMFEGDETIEIALTASNAVQLGSDSEATITVKQQDGKIIALIWDDAHTDVDMDMFLWIGETVDNLDGVIATAITPRTTPRQELIFIPTVISADIVEAAFGLSLIYYEGTANPMNFEVQFIDYAAGSAEAEADRDVYGASYTLANINAWDAEGAPDPIVVQTFRIVNGEYVDISGITVPASGSRVRSQKLPHGLEKRMWIPSKPL
ncbi:MAG TPA: Calx-beta domain-containing protein [Chryseosolibacter sp.]|nr:Calx-beta domain-containing protein [Chryseosolibacter sp.]